MDPATLDQPDPTPATTYAACVASCTPRSPRSQYRAWMTLGAPVGPRPLLSQRLHLGGFHPPHDWSQHLRALGSLPQHDRTEHRYRARLPRHTYPGRSRVISPAARTAAPCSPRIQKAITSPDAPSAFKTPATPPPPPPSLEGDAARARLRLPQLAYPLQTACSTSRRTLFARVKFGQS